MSTATRRRSKVYVLILVFLVVMVLGSVRMGFSVQTPILSRISAATAASAPPKTRIVKVLLSGKDYQTLWYEALATLPDLHRITDKPPITGDSAADKHIQLLAERRGYRLQAESRATLVPLDGERVHSQLKSAWIRMSAAAQRDGVRLVNNSGFRSVDRQRQLFVSRFRAAGGSRFSASDIAAGKADHILQNVLSTSSIPGYSRHHTGYTVDVGDQTTGQTFQSFASSPGYRWMSANNYANARRFGFIPSYPPGAGSQGPNPEPWEFVWIGDLQIPTGGDVIHD